MNNHLNICVIALVCLFIENIHGVSVDQIKKSSAIVRKQCIKKLQISDAKVNSMNSGVFADDRDLKCYATCCLESMRTMKDGKINYDAVIKQIDTMMPAELKEPTRNAMTICKDVTDGITDNCEAGYTILKCLYKNNPTFMFP